MSSLHLHEEGLEPVHLVIDVGSTKVKIQGKAHPAFRDVVDTFVSNFQSGKEIGAGCFLCVKNHVVVDLWAGTAIKRTEKLQEEEWGKDTMAYVFSCTKAMANMVLVQMEGKGLCNLDDQVSKFWPEFGQSGKDTLTISELISHQAGLSCLDGEPISPEDLDSWTKYLKGKREGKEGDERAKILLGRLERQSPCYPLSQSLIGYSPILIGFYVSELVTRIDTKKRCVSQYFKEEIGDKLGVNFRFSFPEENERDGISVAKLYQLSDTDQVPSRFGPEWNFAVEDVEGIKKAPSQLLEEAQLKSLQISRRSFALLGRKFSAWRTRKAELPSSVGFSSCRDLALCYHHFARSCQGNVAQSPFLPSSCQRAVEPIVVGNDLTIFSRPSVYSRCGFAYLPKFPGAFFHGGSGGSIGLGDWKEEMGFAYIPNALLQPSFSGPTSPPTCLRSQALVNSVYSCLDEYHKKSKKAKL